MTTDFHLNICGEGGAILINDEQLLERAEIIRAKGTNRSQFFRGEVDKYTWVEIGSSYLPSDLLAAFLYAQLEKMDEINKQRGRLFDYYFKALIPLANDGFLRLPYIANQCRSNSHLYYIILKEEKIRDELMHNLKSEGIHAVFHYVPLHLSPVGRSMGYRDGHLPVTEPISRRLLRLPFYNEMTEEDQAEVVDAIMTFLRSIRHSDVRPLSQIVA